MAEIVSSGGEVTVAGETVSATNPLPVQAFIPMRVEDMSEMIRLLAAIEMHLASITDLTFEDN